MTGAVTADKPSITTEAVAADPNGNVYGGETQSKNLKKYAKK